MKLMNNVQLIGYLGADPIIKSFENGKTLTILKVATHDLFTNSAGEKINQTVWHNVRLWNRNTEWIIANFIKGSKVLVEGKLAYRMLGKPPAVKYYANIDGRYVLNLDR